MKYKEILTVVTAVVLSISTVVTSGKTPKELAPAGTLTTETTVTAFDVMPGAVYALTQNEYDVICSVVMAEAGAEPIRGQKAVAQCILNACRKENKRPLRILQDYGYTKKRPTPTEQVKEVVDAVFTDGEEAVGSDTVYFYAPKVRYSAWHESQKYDCTIGGHRFFASWT